MTNAATLPGDADRIHYCFGSDNPECSGCVPCPDCAHMINIIVVGTMLEATGLSQHVHIQDVVDGLGAGFHRLHEIMNTDENMQALVRRRIYPPKGTTSVPAKRAEERGVSPGAPTKRVEDRVAAPPEASAAAVLGQVGTRTVAVPREEAPVVERVTPRARAPMAEPMTAEEIASSGRVVRRTEDVVVANGAADPTKT